MNQKQSYNWMSWGIVMVALNLRVPITAIPPMIPKLSEKMGISPSMAGILTTIPLITFALTSTIVAKWGRKVGNERSLFITLILLFVGSLLRIVPSFFVLILGTILIGVGISGGNVLLPAIIKNNFPNKIAQKMTVYTVIMGLTAGLGMSASGVLLQHFSMGQTLALFTLLPLLGVLVWGKAASYLPKVEKKESETRTIVHSPLYKSPLAWAIALYFGLQAFLFYSLMTWFPTIWQEMGFSALVAGNLTTVFQLCGVPAMLVVPIFTEKKQGMKISVFAISTLLVLGTIGVMLPGASLPVNLLAAVLIGLGMGAVFPLCMIFFQKKTQTHQQTADLSGFSQSIGYLFAAIGPVLYGFLHEWTGNWNILLGVTVSLAIVMLGIGLFIEKSTQIVD